MITRKRLRELLSYSPVVGAFEWRTKRRKVNQGGLAGSVGSYGYIKMCVDGVQYPAHRLAWLYMTGEWPEEIDHIDGDKCNNAFDNLRPATRFQNAQNCPARKASATGIKNVFPCGKGYQVAIRANGKYAYRKQFNSLDEAAAMARVMRDELHAEFANHGVHKYIEEEACNV